MQLRKDLAGIEQAIGIESAFQALLMRQVGFIEHRAHQIALFDPNPVLAGQHAANLDAKLENVGAEFLGPGKLARLIGVVQDQRMEIAIAGVEDVGDT
jgi:hypothetical protein